MMFRFIENDNIVTIYLKSLLKFLQSNCCTKNISKEF